MIRSIAVVALCASTVVAQQQPAPVPPGTDLTKLTESIDVRVINVDVVVTDKKGTVIHGLKKDDFEIYENGVPKVVSNFYEVQGSKPVNTFAEVAQAAQTATGAPAVPARPAEISENMRRRVIFFIDNLSLNPFSRNKVFSQMKDFIHNVMRPGDEAMIATFNRSMKVRVPFTRDTTQLIQTLDIIAGESAMGTQVRSDRKQTEEQIRDARSYDDAVATARAYAQSAEHDLRQAVESINGLMSTLAGVEGKKVMVLTSEGFPIQPGKEAFYFIDEMSREKGSSWGTQGGSVMLEGMGFDATNLIQSVARTANANGITMYTIHAGGLSAGSEISAENDRPTSYTVSQAAISNSTDSMQMLAEMTGGTASILTNNFKRAFDRIQTDLDSYYSLGYRAGTERVDRQRSLNVRMKNKQYIARSRQTFVEKSTFAEMSDRVVANLLYKTKANDLHILMKADTPRPSEELFRVPIEVQIPMESLTLLPQGDEMYVGGFEVYVVVGNKDGDMSDVARKEHQIHVTREEMKNLAGKYYTYSLELLMEPGLNKISAGVVDSISNVSGFAREQILAKDLR